MTIKEARILLCCENVVDVMYAISLGKLSEEEICDEDDGFDLNNLQEEATQIVLKELDKKDKVINELLYKEAQRILYDSKEEEIQKYAEKLKQKYFKKVEEENE